MANKLASNVNDRTYQEVEYLKKSLGPILVAALAEICIRRPADPIEYLGHWLLRWRYNEELKRRDVQNAMDVVKARQWSQVAEDNEAAWSSANKNFEPLPEEVAIDTPGANVDTLFVAEEAPIPSPSKRSGGELGESEGRKKSSVGMIGSKPKLSRNLSGEATGSQVPLKLSGSPINSKRQSRSSQPKIEPGTTSRRASLKLTPDAPNAEEAAPSVPGIPSVAAASPAASIPATPAPEAPAENNE